jgi:UDP-2,4-diacetamido-2,4,6-trideoxy-beta-L-altropyranose hydrolase
MTCRVAFRVDASASIGQGHLSRCLALASRLRRRGADCLFVGGRGMSPWLGIVKAQGHEASLIDEGIGASEDALQTLAALRPCGADWLVVDHYGLDARWHASVRPGTRRLLALDDLADRPLDADAVLDPSPCASGQSYSALVRPGCELLLGPAWCLLRDEFSEARSVCVTQTGTAAKRIHLAFGGTDPADRTLQAARLLLEWFDDAQVVAVLGQEGAQAEALKALAAASGGRLDAVIATSDVAGTMARCDCAVGAPGGTLWERFCMGLPTACATTAATQRPVIEQLAHGGWLLDLGDAADFGHAAQAPLRAWLADGPARDAQRRRLLAAVDGLGAERAAAWMLDRVA